MLYYNRNRGLRSGSQYFGNSRSQTDRRRSGTVTETRIAVSQVAQPHVQVHRSQDSRLQSNPFGYVRLGCSAFCVLRPICFLSERGDGIETKEKEGNQLYRDEMPLLRRERYLSVSGRNLSGEPARGDAVCLLPISVL